MSEFMIVLFSQKVDKYNPGERAGFPAEIARELVKRNLAEFVEPKKPLRNRVEK